MRVFISYRRSDTGGRAGRLRDVLASRLGDDHVFHDVTTLTPGTDFDEQIEATIARCDVVLVVIGNRWLDETDTAGRRRLDLTDDLVRQEVRTALSLDKRIVPVLVDAATLPPATELPDDIASMVRRHAVAVRDESWHQDVNELVRGLEGRPSGRTRRPAAYVLAALLATAAGVGVVALLPDGGDGGDDDADLPPCTAEGEWIVVTPGDTSPVDVTIEDTSARFEPLGASYRPDGEGALVVVEVKLTNLEQPEPPADADADGADDNIIYLASWNVDPLLVDGVPTPPAVCAHVTGDVLVEPGRTSIGRFGYQSEIDPAGASIVLATAGGGLVPFGTG